jgi:DNA replication protein DnaC
VIVIKSIDQTKTRKPKAVRGSPDPTTLPAIYPPSKTGMPTRKIALPPPAATQSSAALPYPTLGQPDCPLCHGLGYLSEDRPLDHPRFGRIEPCDCRKEAIAREQSNQLDKLSNLYPDERKIRLDQLEQRRGAGTRRMLRAAHEYLEAPYGLLTLWGAAGNGKTAVLMALVNHFNHDGRGPAAYFRFADLMNVIRLGHHPDTEMQAVERYRRLKSIWFLAIDEIDHAAMTESAQEFRARFFDDRYRLARAGQAHTALAMNDDPAVLPGHIYDRLRWGIDLPAGGFRIIHNADASARASGL